MKANAPEKIYMPTELLSEEWTRHIEGQDIEYTRTDAFIEKAANFLNYKLEDVVATRVPGTIIPHHVAKQEIIEDFKNYMKGE